MSARPRAKSARTARPSRTPQHRIPIGLQIAARVIHGTGANVEYIKQRLQGADAQVVRLLNDPIVGMDRQQALSVLYALGKRFDTENITGRIADAIPDTVTHDPEGLLCDLAICHQYAGLYIGLCFGFRIAASGAGKE